MTRCRATFVSLGLAGAILAGGTARAQSAAPQAPSTQSPAPPAPPPTAVPSAAATPPAQAASGAAPQGPMVPGSGGLGTRGAEPRSSVGTAVPADLLTANTPRAASTSARTRLRLQLLDVALPALAQRSRTNRITWGVTTLVMGAAMGGISFLIPPATATGQPDLRNGTLALGVVGAAGGLLSLAWAPASERMPWDYAQMPVGTARERRARAIFGERALDVMAADAQRRRLAFGIVDIVAQVVSVLVIYRGPLFEHASYSFQPWDAITIGAPGIQVISSIASMFQPLDEDRVRAAYRREMEMARQAAQDGDTN